MKIRWAASAASIALVSTSLTGVAQAITLPTTSPDTTAPARGVVRCDFIPTPDKPPAKPVRPPRPRALSKGTVRATIRTNHGNIALKLNRDNAPCAVHNLVSLARQRFYHKTQCWRLTNYDRLGVLQCGDIFAAEEGGPGYRFADEVTGKETYPRGTLAMGNQGPDTNGSQFFMVITKALIQPNYTVLGKVTKGMAVLDAILAGGIIPGENENDGEPAKPVHIHRVTINH